MRAFFLGLILALAASPVSAQGLGAPDGTWEGSLADVSAPGLSSTKHAWPVRIVIDGSTAHVFIKNDAGAFHEVKPGRFQVLKLLTNAVIAAIDSGEDEDGTWVETWDFAVTLKNHNTLTTSWYRVVNNTGLPEGAKDSKFVVAAVGDLVRVK